MGQSVQNRNKYVLSGLIFIIFIIIIINTIIIVIIIITVAFIYL